MNRSRERRSRIAAGVRLLLLIPVLLATLAGCQAFSRAGQEIGTSVAAMQGQAGTSAGDPVARSVTGQNVVWAKVPKCACHADDPLVRITSKLAEVKANDGIQIASISDTSATFSVTFDPRQVPRDRVIAAIRAGGGEILSGPPTPTRGRTGSSA